MHLSVCIDSIFQGQDPCEALRQAHALGADAYEFWGWWNKDLDALRAEQARLGMTVAGFCTRFESLVDPTAHDAYLAGLRESIAAAQSMGCERLISQTGQDTGEPWPVQRDAMISCLRRAAPLLEDAGITLLVEPLNLLDHPGYALTRSYDALEVLDTVDSPRVTMLFDIYHQQITEGDILRHIERCLPRVGHFHAAGNPGRHELYDGELHYGNIFTALRAMGYDGYVGLEYIPKDPIEAGLSHALAL